MWAKWSCVGDNFRPTQGSFITCVTSLMNAHLTQNISAVTRSNAFLFKLLQVLLLQCLLLAVILLWLLMLLLLLLMLLLLQGFVLLLVLQDLVSVIVQFQFKLLIVLQHVVLTYCLNTNARVNDCLNFLRKSKSKDGQRSGKLSGFETIYINNLQYGKQLNCLPRLKGIDKDAVRQNRW